jgi:hypothetical protein
MCVVQWNLGITEKLISQPLMLATLLQILVSFKTGILPAEFRFNPAKQLFSLSQSVAVPQSFCLPIPDQTPLPAPKSSREVQSVTSKTLGKVKVESSFIRIHRKDKFDDREDYNIEPRLRIYRDGEILYEQKSFPEDTYWSGFYLRDIDLDGEPEVIVSSDRNTYIYQYQSNCDGYGLPKGEGSFSPTKEENLSKITKTTKFGDLTASIKYDKNIFMLYDVNLEITQQGEPIFDGIVDKELVGNTYISVGMRLIDLDHDEDPSVIVKYHTGTCGCHNHTLIYYFDYQKERFNRFTSTLYRHDIEIKDIDGDGKWEILSRGAMFESYGIYDKPILIQNLMHGEFADVTSRFPETIRKDNERLSDNLKSWKSSMADYEKKARKSGIAAYLANKYMLGEGEEVWATLRKVYQESDREEFFNRLEKWLKQGKYDRS